jgi:uncharacterized membrane protein
MHAPSLLFVGFLAFAIGVIAGLRSLTAPAVTAWAAHLGWLNLRNTSLAFLGSTAAVAVLTLLALVELVTDKLPVTPSRLKPPGLIARFVMGGLSGAAVALAGALVCLIANIQLHSLALGAVLGAAGGIAGAFAGYQVRTRLVRALKVPDFVIAVLEDLIAIAAGLCIVSRF